MLINSCKPVAKKLCVQASDKGLEMKALFNNNLATPTKDVMINPVNPDSKPRLKATPKTKTTYR
jgi:hypothetical protein